MNKAQAEKLLTLAHFLRTEVAEEHFDMTSVISESLMYDQANPGGRLQEGFCGSTACAIGWCPIVFPEDWGYFRTQYSDRPFWYVGLGPEGSGSFHYAAVDYFGLKDREASHLFSGEVQRTPVEEAKEIEKMVAKYGYEYAD